MRSWTWVALLGILTGFVSRDAEAASTTVAVDVGTAVHPNSGATTSPTLGLRLGNEIDLAVARITPEVGIVGAPENSFVGVIGGARLSILRFIEPGVYAHLGYGGIVGEPGWLTSDAGLQLDLALAHVRVGIHGGVEVQGTNGRYDPWLTAGIHTGVAF